MKAYALLGGPEQEWPANLRKIFVKAKAAGDLIIGVDRGSFLLTKMNIGLDLAIGDFDSLRINELDLVEENSSDVRYSTPIKDLTDSELMIRTVFEDYHVSELVIYGATGGRIDHLLVNLLMLLNSELNKFVEKVTIVDRQNEIKYFKAGNHKVNQRNEYPYFGIAALTAVEDLNIENARYNLTSFSSNFPRIFSSNEFKADSSNFNLSFKKGIVAVIFSKDIDRFQQLK